MKGYFITGTDTEIGKTLVTALLTFGIQQLGHQCIPFKPIASGAVDHEGQNISEDVLVYQKIAMLDIPSIVLNPLCFEKPASPHLAAELENQTIDLQAIFQHLQKHSQGKICLVEGVGGWRVPISRQYFVSDFAKDLGLPVILVSANRLGTINHTLLTAERILADGHPLQGIVMTQKEPVGDAEIARDNMVTLARSLPVPIVGAVPYLEPTFFEKLTIEKWSAVKTFFKWKHLGFHVD